MTWPVFAVGDKVTSADYAAMKSYIDNTAGTDAGTNLALVRRDANGNADVGIPLEEFARFTVVSASLTSAVVSDRTLVASASPGIANDPQYSLSSGRLVIGSPGVYLVTVAANFNGTNSRKFVNIVNVSGVDADARLPYQGTEDNFTGAMMLTVATTGTFKLQAYQETGATTFSAFLRIQRLARLT